MAIISIKYEIYICLLYIIFVMNDYLTERECWPMRKLNGENK